MLEALETWFYFRASGDNFRIANWSIAECYAKLNIRRSAEISGDYGGLVGYNLGLWL
jgi:hypothetical protein